MAIFEVNLVHENEYIVYIEALHMYSPNSGIYISFPEQ